MIRVTNNVKLLSMGFFLIFFGFNGIQQYITTYFQDLGMRGIGFISLTLIYLVFTLASPFCAGIVARIGAKQSMNLAAGFYILYCLALLTASQAIIYIASVFLGAAGALLWTAQNAYLIRASDRAVYGTNAGVFSTIFSIGTALGILLLGWLLPVVGFYKGFFVFALAPILAFLFFARMDNIRSAVQYSKRHSITRVLKSPTALRISAVWFPFNFINGLIIGVLPLTIGKVFGNLQAIGILTAFFFIAPVITAYALGRLSDRAGREHMISTMYALSIIGVGLLFLVDNAAMLVAAIVLLSGNYGLARTITFALVGDVSPAENVEDISALTWTVQGAALVSALLLSALFQGQTVYIIACIGIILSYLWFWPIRRLPLDVVRQRIAGEIR